MSDTMLTSTNEQDITTRFGNEASKECISNSNARPRGTSFFEKVSLASARNIFWHPEMQLCCLPNLQTSLFACLVWHIAKLDQ